MPNTLRALPTRRRLIATGVALWIAAGARAQEGGIEVFAAQTLFDQGWRVSESHLYKRKGNVYRGSNRVSDPEDRLFEEHRAVTGLDYGLLPGLTLSALIPVVYKRQEQRTAGNKETLESFGLVPALGTPVARAM